MIDLNLVTDKVLTLDMLLYLRSLLFPCPVTAIAIAHVMEHVMETEFFKSCKRTMRELLNPAFEKSCQSFISTCLKMSTL